MAPASGALSSIVRRHQSGSGRFIGANHVLGDSLGMKGNTKRDRRLLFALILFAVSAVVMGLSIFLPAAPAVAAGPTGQAPGSQLRGRLERALDRWSRWLSGYLYQVPGTELYTLNPTLGGGANPYRAVAGNPFAAGVTDTVFEGYFYSVGHITQVLFP